MNAKTHQTILEILDRVVGGNYFDANDTIKGIQIASKELKEDLRGNCKACVKKSLETLYGLLGKKSTVPKVDKKKSVKRLSICFKCPYAVMKQPIVGPRTIWCGPPLRGKMIEHKGNFIKLCGCCMDIKTKFNLPCPAGKF
jgi:hypothetical protein